MEWIESNGGPLICVPNSALALWRGIDALGDYSQKAGAYRSDYDRACAIMDFLGVVPIGNSMGIVLGDMPMPTTILASTKGLPVIARICCADPSADIPMLLGTGLSPPNAKRVERVIVSIPERVWYLFDSAYPGDWSGKDCLKADFPIGSVYIDTFEYRPNDQTFLIVHQFNSLRHSSAHVIP